MNYKIGDIVVVRKKFTDDWGDDWLSDMDYYVNKKCRIINIRIVDGTINEDYKFFDLELLDEQDSTSYAFPLKSLDNRKQKIDRLYNDL